MISLTFHVAIGLVAAFTIYLAYQAAGGDKSAILVIPSSFEDPSFSEHPGGIPHPGEGGDPTQEAAIKAMAERMKNDGFNVSGNANPTMLPPGGGEDLAGIFLGAGGRG